MLGHLAADFLNDESVGIPVMLGTFSLYLIVSAVFVAYRIL